jgi:hypothetical protein
MPIELRGLTKAIISFILTVAVIGWMGFNFENWLVISLAGWAGMLWQSAGHDLFPDKVRRLHEEHQGFDL